jgi:UDP-N-acetylmuramyl tripeptide synthase
MQLADHRLAALPHAADSSTCRNCGADLAYDALYISHLGDWHCPGCGRRRPDLDVSGHDVRLNGMDSLTMRVQTSTGASDLTVGLPGLYNAYNALAAVAGGTVLGVPVNVMQQSLAAFTAAFGRLERVTWQNRHLTMILVKNPVGFNEVLRMLTSASGTLDQPVLIAINDLDADGRDVSWLWDVDFELLAAGEAPIMSTGIRATDMTNRLKYAGVPLGRLETLIAPADVVLLEWIAGIPEGASGIILPTYTAMLDIRRILAASGAIDAFWKQ